MPELIEFSEETFLHLPIPHSLTKLKELKISPTFSDEKLKRIQLIAQLLKINLIEETHFDTFQFLYSFYSHYFKSKQMNTEMKEEQ